MTPWKCVALPCVLLVTACASGDVPVRQLADSQAAVRAATDGGADHNPQASAHMQLARDRLAHAQSLSLRGDQLQAEELMEQAEVDAELALALTRREQARSRAEEAQRQLDTLLKEGGR